MGYSIHYIYVVPHHEGPSIEWPREYKIAAVIRMPTKIPGTNVILHWLTSPCVLLRFGLDAHPNQAAGWQQPHIAAGWDVLASPQIDAPVRAPACFTLVIYTVHYAYFLCSAHSTHLVYVRGAFVGGKDESRSPEKY